MIMQIRLLVLPARLRTGTDFPPAVTGTRARASAPTQVRARRSSHARLPAGPSPARRAARIFCDGHARAILQAVLSGHRLARIGIAVLGDCALSRADLNLPDLRRRQPMLGLERLEGGGRR